MRNLLLVFCFLFVHTGSYCQYTLEWAKTMAGSGANEGFAITADADGNVYSCGGFTGSGDFDPGPGGVSLTSSPIDMYGMYVQKLDSSGILVWVKQIGAGAGFGRANSITTDKMGNVYITGVFSGSVDFDSGPGVFTLSASGTSCLTTHIFVLKLDASGGFVWAKEFESNNLSGCNGGIQNRPEANSIMVDEAGFIYTTGAFGDTTDFDPGPGNFILYPSVLVYQGQSYTTLDLYITKLDSGGNFIWAKKIGSGGNNTGSNSETGREIRYSEGYLYISGVVQGQTPVDYDPGNGVFSMISFCPGALGFNSYVVKLDTAGDFSWAKMITSNNSVEITAMNIDNSGEVLIGGTFTAASPADLDPSPANYYLTTSLNGFSGFLAKWDSSGGFQWAGVIEGKGTINPAAEAKTVKITGVTTDYQRNTYWAGYFNDTIDFDPQSGQYLLASKRGVSVFGDTVFTDDAFILKVSPSGGLISVIKTEQKDNLSGNEHSRGIALDSENNIFTTGSYNDTTDFDPSSGTFYLSNGGFSNIFIQKLSQCRITSISEVEACDEYFFNNQYYSSSGVYSEYFNGSDGCDSVITIHLTIATLNTATSVSGGTISANQQGVSYQWINCQNGAPVTGAVFPDFTPQISGSYAVILDNGLCQDTSLCVEISVTGISEALSGGMNLYPNPLESSITIEFDNPLKSGKLMLYDSKGSLIYTETGLSGNRFHLDTLEWEQGIYLLDIREDKTRFSKKVIKH